jgi:hypothetical protein
MLVSDQLLTWSDEYIETDHRRLAKAPPSAPAPIAPAQSGSSRFPHRALQTLWQARMQVCRWSRSWSQVLSFGELPGPAAANGLCAAGVLRADQRVAGQLSASSRALRTDLRDQSRTLTSPRGALNDPYEHRTLRPSRTAGYRVGRCAPRQYARSVAHQGPAFLQHCGGSR